MPTILVVCTANICRSPVAEALLRDRLQKRGLTDWEVSSAGSWAEPGQKASAYSVQLLAEQGIDIQDHLSSTVDEKALADSDLVLCMEIGQVEALRAEFPQYVSRIFLLTEMSGRRYSVNDPYGGPRIAYERMVREVTDLVEEGLPRIIHLAQTNNHIRLASEESGD